MILPYFSFKTFILVLLIPFHAAWLPRRTKQSVQVLWACEGRLPIGLHVTSFVWELYTLISQTIKTTGSESEKHWSSHCKTIFYWNTGNLLSQGHCSGMAQGMWRRAQNSNLNSKFTRFQSNRASVEHLRTTVTHGGHTGGGGRCI